MRRILNVAILALFFSTPAWSACDPQEAKRGIAWCKAQCDVPHGQQACMGSGKMGAGTANRNVEAVRNGFGDCHQGGGDEEKQRGNVEQCFTGSQTDRDALLDVACEVYGNCAWKNPPVPLPTPTPGPATKKFEYNQPMKAASDDKNIIIADFYIAGEGNYRSITMDFHRDDQRIFSLSTYAVNFDREAGKLHVKITTYDKSVADVSRHKYYVAGTLEVTPP